MKDKFSITIELEDEGSCRECPLLRHRQNNLGAADYYYVCLASRGIPICDLKGHISRPESCKAAAKEMK